MKVVLLNDTSDNKHFGCIRVRKAYDKLFARYDVEVLGTQYRREAIDRKLCDKADLVIVNGEGCIHHNKYTELLDIGEQYPAALLNCVWQDNADFGAKSILVGDHAFTLPLGDFAVTAFHTALEQKFGITDLGAKLNEVIDCGGLATKIGDIELFGTVVLSEEKIADACVDGLNKLPDALDKQIRKLEFAELHMVGGEGSIELSTKVSSFKGDWDAEFGVNGSGFAMPATFEAVRSN
jgi:hypothetical protein